MALKDKLGALTQQIQTEKKTKAQEEETARQLQAQHEAEEKQYFAEIKEAAELKPIRANIKKLDKEKKSLEMLKGSLDFKDLENPTNHEGMQDYAINTEKGIKDKDTHLESLMTEHREALESVGVETKDQLMSNPEFAEEEEVVSYKKSLERGEDLKMSDAKLKEKLQSLGIDISDDKFSYETAAQAISEKLDIVSQELNINKSKTPEGREEAMEELTSEFEKSIGDLKMQSSFIRDKSVYNGNTNSNHDESFGLELNRNSFYVNYKDDKMSVNSWTNLKLIPGNFDISSEKYGADIAREALEKAYQNKVHNTFVAWDENGDKAITFKEQLKDVSQKKTNEAWNKMDEAADKLNGVLPMLQKKSAELKEKGIDFEPGYVSRYGSYKEIIHLEENTSAVKYIKGQIRDNEFPPRYDCVELEKASSKLISLIDNFTETVNNLKTEEGVKEFLNHNGDHENSIGKLGESIRNNRLRTQEYQFKLEDNNNRAVKKLTDKCKNYREAERYLDEIIADGEKHENMVFDALKTVIEAQLKRKELGQEIKEGGTEVGNKINHLESRVEKVARNKKEAIRMISSIDSIQAELSQEDDLHLDGNNVYIKSIVKECEELNVNRPLKKKDLEAKKNELIKHETSKPALFGKEKWQTKLDSLKLEKNKLENEYNELERKDGASLWKRSYRVIGADEYSDIGKKIRTYNAEGKASEIFTNLRAELMEIVDEELPADLMQKYNEYKRLEAKLSGKE